MKYEPTKIGDKYWALLNDNDTLVNFMQYVWGNKKEERNSMMAWKGGRKVKIEIPKEELQKMLDEGHNKVDIAQHFGVSPSKFYTTMRDYGIKADQQGKHTPTKDLDLNEVKKYLDEGLTRQEIAWRCRVGTTKLYKFLKQNNLEGYKNDKTKSKSF